MMDFFYSFDLAIFYFINHSLSTGFLDKFFSTITDVNKWYIAYVILAGIAFFKGGVRGKILVVGLILLIVVTDQTGYRILKEFFERLRPCRALTDAITPLGCSGGYSFPSNHALNNFAAATFISRLFPNYKWVVFTVAALIALSRVYLGVHYPSDILVGALIGTAFGYLFSLAALPIAKKFQVTKNS
ncbi:MAG: phosphatase PAP2 family protein [Ignavibacteria bacterium]|nr:phosphatase PAP2 family protein [Ignavibacteria bacterium]MBT8383798.1 phosphatase PAP2 family protein [Ignavibacteria bacterium]MBT8391599.1 phosphatase PAP2 family protein [Ignavibacteria bacterium]NNJ53732.1 phosphatase PAP2 family protein [Ignavibacteriaceae bacterium]NNL21535.1 phosphatase PAP2 family protein [Ignavibacteriaceae bacterium]